MLCTVILNLSTVAELTEGTVTILMEHIKTCFKMLRDSLTGIFVVQLYIPSQYCIISVVFQQILLS